ncbi:MAG: hypothetical protein EBU90_03015 [Proteobacteria bacterium]|nr:hypothetical protein [Pseudomonadota bacterium]
MSINPLNDISRVYLEQVAAEAFVDPEHGEAPSGRTPLQNVSDHPKASVRKRAVGAFKKQMGKEYGGTWKSRSKDPVDEAAKPDYLDFDKDGDEKESMKKALKDKAKKKIEEAKKEKPKRWWDDDGDNIGYEPGEVSGKFKKKVAKEGFSNWREELIEVVDKIETNKTKDQRITEKEVNNKIVINPKLDLGEAIENLGGQLLEMVEIESFDSIFDDLSESEIFLLSDDLIEEVVEEFFQECLEEGYDAEYIENTLVESIELSAALLNEAKVTLGHDTQIKSDRLEKVKTAVKKVGGAVARGAGYVAGAAVRGAKAAGREFAAGYARGRGGSSSQASAPSSSTASSTGSSRPGLLGRIGSALKSGLKRAVAKGARAVSRGARNVARRMETGEAPKAATPTPTTPKAAAKQKAPSKSKRGQLSSKADELLADIRKEETQLDEKTLTSAETKEKERIVKSMKDKAADFEKRYPGRGKEVMYATATKMAKKVAEQAMELQPKTQPQTAQPDPKAKVAAQRAKSAEINILQRRLQAIRQTPAGTPVSGIGG